jgi:hypothetical protein
MRTGPWARCAMSGVTHGNALHAANALVSLMADALRNLFLSARLIATVMNHLKKTACLVSVSGGEVQALADRL